MKKKCRYDKTNWQFAISNWQILPVAFCLLLILFGCGEKKSEQKSEIKNPKSEIYYCPMHPDVQQDHPGKCPREECHGMELVLKTSDTLLEKVLKPVSNSVLASIKITKPAFHKMNLDVEATGYIDYDIRSAHNISSLYSGRIEKLYLKYPYQPVHKGEKLFEIYSPELVTAQENLIYLLENDPDDTGLINAAKQKLKLLGFSDNLLDEIYKTKKVKQAVPVYSNYAGHAHAAMKTSADNMNAMTSQKKNSTESANELSIKEGMYVMMGETIFNIMNPNDVVIMLQIKPEDVSKIKIGEEAEFKIDDNSGMTMEGKIDFIEPVFKNGFKTMTARIYIDNSKGNHHIGSLVKAKIKAAGIETLWIPLAALVDLGKEKIVLIKSDGNFSVRKVETGAMTNSMIEISDGLTEEDEIAAEAHYLIDSEGFISTNDNQNEN